LVAVSPSDMTRTLMIGEPSDTQTRMYEVVRDAQAAGVAAVKAGVEAKSVDDACRSVIRDAGWDEAFLHGTGHGVGLDIHEPPRVARTTDAMLTDGHVVTVEACTSPSTAGSASRTRSWSPPRAAAR
jgi:Xaa-Pro aminopeptidase